MYHKELDIPEHVFQYRMETLRTWHRMCLVSDKSGGREIANTLKVELEEARKRGWFPRNYSRLEDKLNSLEYSLGKIRLAKSHTLFNEVIAMYYRSYQNCKR